MDKSDGGFSEEYAGEKSTDTKSAPAKEPKEEKTEEVQYNIAKPKRRYIRGFISKDED